MGELFLLFILSVKQELLTFPEHVSSSSVLVGFVLLIVKFLLCFVDHWLSFLAIILSVLPRYTTSDYPFGISNPFFLN